jgi:trimeric autotransporter adhesin
MSKMRRHLSFANVVACLALFAALGGVAVAAGLPKNSVGTKQLKPKAVKTGKLAPEAVKAGKVAKNAIAANRLRTGAVTGSKVADGAIGTSKLADGAVTSGKLATQYLPADTPGVPLAGANVAADGTLRGWFNRAGGAPTVSKLGTGTYKLVFPGLEGRFFAIDSIGQVSLVQGSGEVQRASQEGDPVVITYDSAGAEADRAFELVLFQPSP